MIQVITREHAVGHGIQHIVFFPNGHGASLVRAVGPGGIASTYGADQGLWELAVLRGTPDAWVIDYTTPITDDVLGWLDHADLAAAIIAVARLPKVGGS